MAIPAKFSNYTRKATVPVNGSADGDQTDYTLKISLLFGNGTNSAGIIYLESGARDDFVDLIAVDADDATVLPIALRDVVASTSADLYVKIPSIPSAGKNIHLYWGSTASVVDQTKEQIAANALNRDNHNVTPYATPLWTHGNNQYTVFCGSDFKLYVGKRQVSPSVGAWSVQDTGKIFTTPLDSHHTPSVGVDPNGYIHVVWNYHDDVVTGRYIVSTNPEDITAWTDKTQFTGSNEGSVTYPTFIFNGSNLQMHYRNGTFGDGELYLIEYNHTTTSWSAIHAPLINPVADTRSPYVNDLVYDSAGNLHVSWCWREQPGAQYNEKVCYAIKLAADGLWYNSDRTTQYALPITYAASEVIDNVLTGQGLLNQNGMDVDSNDRPHIAYFKEDVSGYLNYYHTYQDNSGVWHIDQLTNFTRLTAAYLPTYNLAMSRPKIFCNGTDGVTVFRCFENGPIFAVKGTGGSYSAYRLGEDRWGKMEAHWDRGRLAATGQLDIFASQIALKNGDTPAYTISSDISTWGAGDAVDIVIEGASDVIGAFLGHIDGVSHDDWAELVDTGNGDSTSSDGDVITLSVADAGGAVRKYPWYALNAQVTLPVKITARQRANFTAAAATVGTGCRFSKSVHPTKGTYFLDDTNYVAKFTAGKGANEANPVQTALMVQGQSSTSEFSNVDNVWVHEEYIAQQGAFDLLRDGSSVLTNANTGTLATGYASLDYYIDDSVASGPQTLELDYLHVQKYTANEPTIGTATTEGGNTAPVANARVGIGFKLGL